MAKCYISQGPITGHLGASSTGPPFLWGHPLWSPNSLIRCPIVRWSRYFKVAGVSLNVLKRTTICTVALWHGHIFCASGRRTLPPQRDNNLNRWCVFVAATQCKLLNKFKLLYIYVQVLFSLLGFLDANFSLSILFRRALNHSHAVVRRSTFLWNTCHLIKGNMFEKGWNYSTPWNLIQWRRINTGTVQWKYQQYWKTDTDVINTLKLAHIDQKHTDDISKLIFLLKELYFTETILIPNGHFRNHSLLVPMVT